MKKNIIKKILYKYLLIRETELRISSEYKKQNMRCPVHLSIGQESISSALSAIYNKNDYLISNHRCHAHYLSKSNSLYEMIAELHGLSDGCSKGVGGSMHLVDEKNNFLGSTAIVSNSIPVGIGFAFGKKLDKKKSRIFIFIGDASVESGVFYESINFALIHNLKVTFVCENNFYSVYSSFYQRQPKNREIFKLVSSMGIKSIKIKTNNPFKIYKKIKNFIPKYQINFIEIETYRYVEHCGPNNDDKLNYRPKKEIKHWVSKDFNKKIFSDQYVKKNLRKKEILNLKNGILKKLNLCFYRVNKKLSFKK